MEKLGATTTFILDIRREKKGKGNSSKLKEIPKEKPESENPSELKKILKEKADKVYPVKLRVIYKRQNRLYGTMFDLTPDEFDKVMGAKPRDEYKIIRKKLDAVEDKAIVIIKGLKEFSFEEFGVRFSGKVLDPKSVFNTFEEYISDLEKESRVGTANSYTCAFNSFRKFHPKENLNFHEVNVQFLKSFESWSVLNNNGLTTVGIYARCLRAIYNLALDRKIALVDEYPFGRGKYVIPSPRNVKKALPLQDIKKIVEYIPENEIVRFHRDLWIFSYLCNGANIKDVCLLKYSDISGDSIIFRRAKTSKTNKNSKPIIASYTEHIRPIIEKWGNKPNTPDAYIFPVLQGGESERRIKEKVAQLVDQINKYINKIAKTCEIPMKVTTYTARHSFATIMKRAGVGISFISEFLGHSDEKTTEAYLGSIEDSERSKMAENLTNF